MIFGVGTDIVRIDRMERNIGRYGHRFAQRILAAAEYEEYRSARRPARFLAKRFAAKEAAVKALGTGFSDGVSPRQIAVAHDPRGKPTLVYHGRAEALCRDVCIHDSHLSLADEEEYAIAFVTLVAGA